MTRGVTTNAGTQIFDEFVDAFRRLIEEGYSPDDAFMQGSIQAHEHVSGTSVADEVRRHPEATDAGLLTHIKSQFGLQSEKLDPVILAGIRSAREGLA